MTFCLAIKVRQGLVALADTQVVKGSERVSKSKITLLNQGTVPPFQMTSRLRSVRDKTVTILKNVCRPKPPPIRACTKWRTRSARSCVGCGGRMLTR